MPARSLIILFIALALPLRAEDWTTTDGNTYSDVTIRSVEGDTVTISDQNGNDTVSLSALPPKFQKEVRYFAAKASGHPVPAYFPIADAAKAEALARQLHVPLAWMCSFYSYLDPNTFTEEGDAQLTRMALDTLRGRAIVIFSENTDPMPPNVHHQGFSPQDDGPLGHANFICPKVVFSSPDTTQLWGRVSRTQMNAKGKDALLAALDTIDNDPAAQAMLAGQPAPTSAASSGSSSSDSSSPSTPPPSTPTPAPASDPSRLAPDDQ